MENVVKSTAVKRKQNVRKLTALESEEGKGTCFHVTLPA